MRRQAEDSSCIFTKEMHRSCQQRPSAGEGEILSCDQICDVRLRLSYGRGGKNCALWDGGRSTERMAGRMAREVNIGDRRFWVVSEPAGRGWKAQVLEVIDARGVTNQLGIESVGDTRSMADDRALGKLQHRLRDQSF